LRCMKFSAFSTKRAKYARSVLLPTAVFQVQSPGLSEI
jgi:hypothetical protein